MISISWIGIVYIILLICPNIIWTYHQPIGYDASIEDKRLLFMERVGQVCTTCFAIISFEPIVYQWNIFLMISMISMVLYEGFWIRYFLSEKTLKDFYSSFLGIPIAGATLPIIAFLCLGISFQNLYLIISVIILGIGHIGIHYQHVRKMIKRLFSRHMLSHLLTLSQ